MNSPTTVIIGGGVIGLSTAYHLAQKKFGRIILLEKGLIGEGSSSRAAGITTGLLWSETGVRARKKAIELFQHFSQELEGYRYHNEHGCLNLFSPELWPARSALLPLYARLGAAYQILNAAQMRKCWPDLHPPADYVGLHDPLGGYSESEEYIPALAKRVRDLGVEIRESEKVTDFIFRNGRVAGVKLAGSSLEAEAVISTVHVWSMPLFKKLGLKLPIKHFVHQRYVSAPFESPFAFPPVNADSFGGYIRPAAGNRLLLGVETSDREEWRMDSTDFRMTECTAPDDLCARGVGRFSELIPAVTEAKWGSEKVGLISFSIDGEPILGPVAEFPGLFVGVSFHSGGFSYSPVAGLLLAELVAEGKTFMDITAFSPNRFSPEQVEAHLSATVTQSRAVRRRH